MSNREGWVYLMRLNENTDPLKCAHKIGRTADLKARHKMIHVKMPYPVTLVIAVHTTDMYEVETFLHRTLETNRLHGEWFRLEDWQIRTFCAMALQDATGEHAELVDAFATGRMDWDSFTTIRNAITPLMRGQADDDDDLDLPF